MAEHHTGSTPGLTERSVAGATVVELHGEFDVLAALTLEARFDALTDAPHPDLVLDLRGVTFIDCSGLGLLCRVRGRAAARQGRLRLVADNAQFRRILHHVHLTDVFEILADLPQALDTATAPAVG